MKFDEAKERLLELADALKDAPAPEPKPAHHAPAKIGMLEEAPGQKSVRRVIFFWSYILGWLAVGLLIWRGHADQAVNMSYVLLGGSATGVIGGRFAEAYENKGKKEDEGDAE